MATQKEAKHGETVSLSAVIGGGYNEFWRTRKTFRVVKGGRSSKKSTTTAMWYVWHMMKYPSSNLLVVRQTANTHESSTFAEIQKAVKRLKVSSYWKFTLNPCEVTYKPTGQKILFRGFDDPLKLTSINVATGVLCWVWIEEAYEVDDESAFDTLCEGIRGIEIEQLGLWKQITVTYNPWINSHWTKKRFWGAECRPDTFRLTTTHKCNEFLTQADHDAIEALNIKEINGKENDAYDPDRYLVVGLGEYGMPGGAFFDEFRRHIHVIDPFPIKKDWRRYVTIDYGRDMLACYWIAIDWHDKAYVYRELHKPGLYVSEAAELIKKYNVDGDGKQENIYQWFAPPDLDNKNSQTGKSTLDLFREDGLPFIKVSNNRESGCNNMHEWLRPYLDEQGVKTASMVFFKNCVNVIDCISQIQCDKIKPNEYANDPHDLTHSVDSIRYFTAGRPRSGKEQIVNTLPIGSLEYRVQKNLDRLTKKTRRKNEW